MFSWDELKELTIKPKINDISLDCLSQYYQNYLYPFIYEYNISADSGEKKTLKLSFEKKNFCHLLGIESIARGHVSNKELQAYKGNIGWDSIRNGDYELSDLKALNGNKFRSVKAKFVYFYLLPKLAEKPNAVLFDNSKVIGGTSINSEIVFYSKVEKDNAIIHLGIDYDKGTSFYYPRSFFVEKKSVVDDDIYISSQESIEVTVKNRIITL